jgi:hypothetical protein
LASFELLEEQLVIAIPSDAIATITAVLFRARVMANVLSSAG